MMTLFESFLQRFVVVFFKVFFKKNLQEKLRGSDFGFDGINFLKQVYIEEDHT